MVLWHFSDMSQTKLFMMAPGRRERWLFTQSERALTAPQVNSKSRPCSLMIAFCYLRHWGTLLGQWRTPEPSAGWKCAVQNDSALLCDVLTCTDEILSNIQDLCFPSMPHHSWPSHQPAGFLSPKGKCFSCISWKMVDSDTVLAPHPRNTRIVQALIQVSHLLGDSSEKGLKTVVTSTRKSWRTSDCKQGGAGPPCSAVGGYYISSTEHWIVPLRDVVGRLEIILCILGCKFLAEVLRHCFTAAYDSKSSLTSHCMMKTHSLRCYYYA